jgi:hypothetical protein
MATEQPAAPERKMISLSAVVFPISVLLVVWLTTVVDLVLTTSRHDEWRHLATECVAELRDVNTQLRRLPHATTP